MKSDVYSINDIVMITGLSDRTIRNYISSGLLNGEKSDGQWRFTSQQIHKFITHPSVRPSILAKNNAIVYDFLLSSKKSNAESCMILDLPGDDPKAISEFFCYSINNGDFRNIRFVFDSISGVPRVILKGDTAVVLALVNKYYDQKA